MARSNKPLVWSLFAGGGTLAALVIPALVIVTLSAGYGHVPAALDYQTMQAFAANWIGKLMLFGVVALSLWHAAHRMRTALHGLGLRADKLVAKVVYTVAALGSIFAAVYLLQI